MAAQNTLRKPIQGTSVIWHAIIAVRQSCALSLRRYTWARDARPDGIGLGHEARHRARGQRGRSDLDSAQAAARPTYDTITSQIHPGPGHSWPLKTHSGSLYQVRL